MQERWKELDQQPSGQTLGRGNILLVELSFAFKWMNSFFSLRVNRNRKRVLWLHWEIRKYFSEFVSVDGASKTEFRQCSGNWIVLLNWQFTLCPLTSHLPSSDSKLYSCKNKEIPQGMTYIEHFCFCFPSLFFQGEHSSRTKRRGAFLVDTEDIFCVFWCQNTPKD